MSEVRRQAALLQRPSWGWQDEAACRGREVVLFFGPDGERQPEREIRERKAKAVCAGCPVRAECLTYAVSGRRSTAPGAASTRTSAHLSAGGACAAPTPPKGAVNGLSELPGAAAREVPRRDLVRLPAPAACPAGRGTASLDPSGLILEQAGLTPEQPPEFTLRNG